MTEHVAEVKGSDMGRLTDRENMEKFPGITRSWETSLTKDSRDGNHLIVPFSYFQPEKFRHINFNTTQITLHENIIFLWIHEKTNLIYVRHDNRELRIILTIYIDLY